jgi:hypothetical protein
MIRIIGIIRFIICFVLSMIELSLLITDKYDSSQSIIGSGIVVLLFVFFAYYLIRTGIWNLKKRDYKVGVIILISFLFYLALIISLIYYSIVGKLFSPFTIVISSIFLFTISVYDVKQFYTNWKTNNIKSNL